MKKATKRLMMVVAILLCLVLISTSVVSGIFAKFIIQKSATTSVGFTKFNMEVDLTVTGTTIKGSATKKGDTVIATYNAITLKPGDDYSDLFKITIKGTPKVNTKITVNLVIDYVANNFQIPADKFDSVKQAINFIPVGFKINNQYATTKIDNVTYTTTPYHNYSDTDAEKYVENALGTVLGLNYASNALSLEIGPDKAIKTINQENITVGFDRPDDYNTTSGVDYYDQIGTYLSLHNTNNSTSSKNIGITTFSIEIKAEQIINS